MLCDDMISIMPPKTSKGKVNKLMTGDGRKSLSSAIFGSKSKKKKSKSIF